MTSVPSTCPLTIFLTLPCPALTGQGRAGQVFYILQGSNDEVTFSDREIVTSVAINPLTGEFWLSKFSLF